MDFGLIEDDPPAGAPDSAPERAMELAPKDGRRVGVGARRPGQRVDLAVKDLGDHGVRNSSKGGFDGRIVRSVGVEERGSQAVHRKEAITRDESDRELADLEAGQHPLQRPKTDSSMG
jgi:hypothetical protein